MAQLGRVYLLDTDPAAQFTGAIVQNAEEHEDITPDPAIGASPDCRFRLVGAVITSVERLAWELNFWSRAAGSGAGTVALDSFLGRWSFVANDGIQIGGAGLWRYFIFGTDIPYIDDEPSADRTGQFKQGQIHMSLVNRSAAAKAAGAGGAIKIRLIVDPTLGY